MIALYAVARDPVPASGLDCLPWGPVRLLHRAADETIGDRRTGLLRYAATLGEVFRCTTMLPLRHGSVVDNDLDLRTLAEQRAEAWDRRLTAVDGCGELIVHLSLHAVARSRAASGADYLRRRADELTREESLVQELGAVLVERVAEWRRLPDRKDLRVAALIPGPRQEELRASLTAWAAGRDAVALRVTGPWPPFSFCEEVA